MTTRTEPEPEPERVPLPERRPELDLIRLLVVLGPIFFHSALVFAADDDFYVKNDETTEAVVIIAGLGVVWAMPRSSSSPAWAPATRCGGAARAASRWSGCCGSGFRWSS
ncbi:hypothetical protein GCM10010329_60920 [Streptomyces spiroverticillatus]|uniref:Acyltransferase family protein n=1 Tax=Streptomyces finlayi TaxID=67296 RepID=A0A918X4Q2_9ACTN|nr:hypothetical protein [Streptomyces finlayi]GHA29410.1 hypothetical protein GCM10010329_60920 [Streptomyces spiroverticillatus]GHD09848.1 hypothetical protein GCM10010334_64580 [Streptomyces finlayi]